jgi:hypothetical protein
MLPLPTATVPGFGTGEDTAKYADWVEACALFTGDSISKSEVRDHFYEENTFQRGNADETVADIWSELSRRRFLLNSSFPIAIAENRIEPSVAWQEIPAYSFSLILSYAKTNPEWERHHCCDYVFHGQIFEELSAAALKVKFSGWEVDTIGWSPDNPVALRSQISGICTRLEEEVGRAEPDSSDKDGGIDLLCYYPFHDGRGDHPMFFIQCATGRNWVDKRSVNTMNLWTNWIYFRSPGLLTRGFAVPFLLNDEAFRRTQMSVNGLVLDRGRLFKQNSPETIWLPENLKLKLREWLDPRIPTLIDNN